MEPTSALRLLPEVHARALALEAQGLDTRQLAARLGVEVSSVGPLLRVARAKLAALELLDEPPTPFATNASLRRGAADESPGHGHDASSP
jgi:hypothetical protein